MREWLLVQGTWQTGASLPVTDRAVRYGMSVFETIGVREGVQLFRAEHLALLQENARSLYGLDPSMPDLPELAPSDSGVLRIYITAGDGSPAEPVKDPRVFAIFENLAGAPLPDSQKAYLYPEPVTPFARGRKTGNYWAQCAAQAAAAAVGFDHALISNKDGLLLSAAFGNIFFVMDSDLCTPALTLDVRPGVFRSWVMRHHHVHEIEFPSCHLDEAEEIFMTNSRLGIMPLQLGSIAPGSLGLSLRDTCRREKLIP
jgi:branched-subunit amino acid aminotransferase/4-amino-4-deoxychorismate lyase